MEENIKCLSVTNEQRWHRPIFSDKNERINVYTFTFKLNDIIADIIRKYTKCPKPLLIFELTEENELPYSVGFEECDDAFKDQFLDAVNRIANGMSTKDLYNKILTNNGERHFPADIHKVMEEEYGLEGELEWYVAHLFIHITSLLFSPEFMWTGDFPEENTIQFEFKLNPDKESSEGNTNGN